MMAFERSGNAQVVRYCSMGILTRLRRPGTASLYELIGGHDAP